MVAMHPKPVGARPAPEIERHELHLVPGPPCSICGAERQYVGFDVPDDVQIDPAHLRDRLGGLTRYMRPEADRFGCDACEVKAAAAAIVRGQRPAPPLIRDPAQQVVDAIEGFAATLYGRDAPPAEGPLIVVSHAALAALVRVHRPDLDLSVAGMHEAGRPYVQPLLDRLAAGDYGPVGQLADGDADEGRERGPLASRLDRNAAAVADGAGTIHAVYQVERRDRYNRVEYRETILVDQVVGPDGLVFIHLAGEGE